jgi:hypothetical protein
MSETKLRSVRLDARFKRWLTTLLKQKVEVEVNTKKKEVSQQIYDMVNEKLKLLIPEEDRLVLEKWKVNKSQYSIYFNVEGKKEQVFLYNERSITFPSSLHDDLLPKMTKIELSVIRSLEKERKELEDFYLSKARQIERTIKQFTSSNKLLETLPELKPLVEGYYDFSSPKKEIKGTKTQNKEGIEYIKKILNNEILLLTTKQEPALGNNT